MPRRINKDTRKDRLHVYSLIFELSRFWDNECEVCLKKMKKPIPGFVIHHLEYRAGEKTHKNFYKRLRYYTYLKPLILGAREDRTIYSKFAFLCNACHHSIDGPRGLKRRKPTNVMRLFLMYLRTNT